MSAVQEHKPVEKRRALGRGLDSLLPAGPRILSSASPSPVVPPPVVIPVAAPSVAPTPTKPEPAEIAEIHAAREMSPPKPSLDGAPDALSQPRREEGHPNDGNASTVSRAGAPSTDAQGRCAPHEITELP